MSEHRDEPDVGPGPGAWAAVRAGRWSVPVSAVVALVVVVAVVAVALVVRALTTVPGADLEPVGTAVSTAPTDAARGAGDGGGTAGAGGTDGAVGSRTQGASASAAAAGAPAPGGAAPAGGAPSVVVVHVVGQVRAPGLVELPAGARVADAVDAAGGLTTEADQAAVNLARPVLDGEQLVVPRPGEVPVPAPGPPAAGAGAGGGAAGPGAPPSPVSLSTATPAELDALPGIGPVLAQRIVDWREANGGFRSVDELAEVSGIGDAVLEQVRPLVVV